MATLDDQGSIDSNEAHPVQTGPILFDGQRLDQPAFHEIYSQMPEDFRAELIDGVVYLMNMGVFEDHGRSDASINGLLYFYSVETPGTIVQANTTTKLGPRSEVQPDSALLIDPDFGGRTRSDPGRFTVEAPELVVEISNSTLRLDLNTKKRVYEEAGALEYVVFDIPHRKFHWFALSECHFEPLQIGDDGLYRSKAFPGLWLDEAAFVRGDGRSVMASLRLGLESPEHAAFVELLQANRANRP
jgi:Uma2 family endonuclease